MTFRNSLPVLAITILSACNPESSISQRDLDIAACTGIEQVSNRVACYDDVARSMGVEVFDPSEALAELDEIAATLGININYPNPEYVPREILKMASALDIDIGHIQDFDTAVGVVNLLVVARQVLAEKPRLDFLELIDNFAYPRKLAIELGIRTNRITTLEDAVGGQLGIPRDVVASTTEHGATVANGRVSMTWKNDGSALQGTTYIQTLESIELPFQWRSGGTCLENALC